MAGRERRGASIPPAAVQVLAGAVSGTAVDLIVYPLNTIKTRMQLFEPGRTPANPGRALSGSLASTSSSSAVGWGCRSMYTQSLYAGAATVLLSAPAFGIYMAAYETSKSALYSVPAFTTGGGGALGEAVAGVVAQVAGSFVWVPMEVIRERQQVHAAGMMNSVQGGGGTRLYSRGSSLQVLRTLLSSTSGLSSLYRGFTLSLLSWAPFNAIYFPLYEQCKRAAAELTGPSPRRSAGGGSEAGDGPLPLLLVNASALFSAAVAAAATNPLDVLKTNIQVRERAHGKGHSGVLQSMRTIFTSHGVAGFFRGAGARVVWLTPKHALGFTVYESVKPLMMSALS